MVVSQREVEGLGRKVQEDRKIKQPNNHIPHLSFDRGYREKDIPAPAALAASP